MLQEEEYDTDTSDEDFVPGGAGESDDEPLSGVEESGNEESGEDGENKKTKKKISRKKKKKADMKKQNPLLAQLGGEEEEVNFENESEQKSEEKEKEKANSLWAGTPRPADPAAGAATGGRGENANNPNNPASLPSHFGRCGFFKLGLHGGRSTSVLVKSCWGHFKLGLKGGSPFGEIENNAAAVNGGTVITQTTTPSMTQLSHVGVMAMSAHNPVPATYASSNPVTIPEPQKSEIPPSSRHQATIGIPGGGSIQATTSYSSIRTVSVAPGVSVPAAVAHSSFNYPSSFADGIRNNSSTTWSDSLDINPSIIPQSIIPANTSVLSKSLRASNSIAATTASIDVPTLISVIGVTDKVNNLTNIVTSRPVTAQLHSNSATTDTTSTITRPVVSTPLHPLQEHRQHIQSHPQILQRQLSLGQPMMTAVTQVRTLPSVGQIQQGTPQIHMLAAPHPGMQLIATNSLQQQPGAEQALEQWRPQATQHHLVQQTHGPVQQLVQTTAELASYGVPAYQIQQGTQQMCMLAAPQPGMQLIATNSLQQQPPQATQHHLVQQTLGPGQQLVQTTADLTSYAVPAFYAISNPVTIPEPPKSEIPPSSRHQATIGISGSGAVQLTTSYPGIDVVSVAPGVSVPADVASTSFNYPSSCSGGVRTNSSTSWPASLGINPDFLDDVEEKPAAAPKPKSSSWGALLGKKNAVSSQSSNIKQLDGFKKDVKKTNSETPTSNTVKITQVFEFAGEEIRVEKEVDANSKEAKVAELKTQGVGSDSKSPSAGAVGNKRPAGLSNIMGLIDSKKQKLSVLDKTALDWKSYKSNLGIEEELESHKKSKDGYLEKQDFLDRADVRQFEIEKSMRLGKRSSR